MTRSTVKKVVRTYAKCFLTTLGVVAFFTLFPLFKILLHVAKIDSSKGDQRILEKVKPYVLYGQRPDNLPHFCREFKVSSNVDLDFGNVIGQATTSSERPTFSSSYSMYSFTEEIQMDRLQAISYYLPSYSHVEITSCGQGLSGDDESIIYIFNDDDKMEQWLNSDEQESKSNSAVLSLRFPSCPSTAVVSFNTSGLPDGKWNFLLGSGHQTSCHFKATLKLQFTKRLIHIANPVDTCSSTSDKSCKLKAPDGNQVYLTLDHSISSTYPYPTWIHVSCSEHDPLPYILYFLLLPLNISVGFVLFCWILEDIRRCKVNKSASVYRPVAVYCDAKSWRTNLRSQSETNSSTLLSENNHGNELSSDIDDGFVSDVSVTRIPNNLPLSNFRVVSSADPDNSTDYYPLTQREDQLSQARLSNDLSSILTLAPPPGYEAARLRSIDVPKDIGNQVVFYAMTQPDNWPRQARERSDVGSNSTIIIPPPGYDTALQLHSNQQFQLNTTDR